jgi:hypothetical protein
MTYPPTAKIAAYRRMKNPNCDEIRDYLTELIETLKRTSHYVKEDPSFRELRI